MRMTLTNLQKVARLVLVNKGYNVDKVSASGLLLVQNDSTAKLIAPSDLASFAKEAK